MPQAEPFRAWATFSFTAMSGRVNECDLLVAVPAGLFLIEIKGHPGQLRNTLGRPGTSRDPTACGPSTTRCT
jgi:hypothetical protein